MTDAELPTDGVVARPRTMTDAELPTDGVGRRTMTYVEVPTA